MYTHGDLDLPSVGLVIPTTIGSFSTMVLGTYGKHQNIFFFSSSKETLNFMKTCLYTSI